MLTGNEDWSQLCDESSDEGNCCNLARDRRLVREITEAFANVIDMKDDWTKGHSTRVAKYTRMLTLELGYDKDIAERYSRAALLHDIGKIGISKRLLQKDGRLTEAEYDSICEHPTNGYHILKSISVAPELAAAAACHHERPDGTGYPQGLVGDQIPRVAQIIAVADTFDAMYSDRPYRDRMNFNQAVAIIREGSGTQFFTDVVDAFLRLVKKGKFRADDDNGGGSFDDIDNSNLARKQA